MGKNNWESGEESIAMDPTNHNNRNHNNNNNTNNKKLAQYSRQLLTFKQQRVALVTIAMLIMAVCALIAYVAISEGTKSDNNNNNGNSNPEGATGGSQQHSSASSVFASGSSSSFPSASSDALSAAASSSFSASASATPTYVFIPGANYTVECKTAPAVPQDRRTDKSKLRVASFNAEFLFLGSEKPVPKSSYPYYAIPGRPGDGRRDANRRAGSSVACPGADCSWVNASVAVTHFESVLSLVQSIDADIINLVEIENCTILQRIADYLPQLKYKPYLIKGLDTATGQNVGILTRIDPYMTLARNESRADFPQANTTCTQPGGTVVTPGKTGVTKHYITAFNINGRKVGMMGVHFLASPTDPVNCAKREGQALVTRGSIAGSFSNLDDVIVLGDFNDYDGDVLDVSNSVPTSKTLSIIKTPDAMGGPLLLNVAELVPKPSRYTAWWDKNNNKKDDNGGEHTSIDQFLVSSALYDNITAVNFPHPYIACDKCPPSDHWPLIVDFTV